MQQHAPADPLQPRPTPVMEQYIEIKAANPDCLLFYRMGDFYELFFGDAEVASRALGIALTKRGKHLGEDIPMAGVPVHAADDYLQKLIALGHRVAVCEQLEDPAEARKRGARAVVRRDVVRLVTPGTITEERLLEPGRANWLATLCRVGAAGDGAVYGLARIDISTGAFEVAECDAGALAGELARLEPRELVVADAVFDDPVAGPVVRALSQARPPVAVTPQPRAVFDAGSAAERIARFFEVATVDGFGRFTRAELAAAAGAVAYVERTQVGGRPPLDPPRRETTSRRMAIDAATRTSLEITRGAGGDRRGSLAAAVDRTVTAAGQRLLGERLASPLVEPEAIAARQDAVEWFFADEDRRAAVRATLSNAPDIARALSRIALDRAGPRDLAAVAGGLAAAAEIAALAGAPEAPEEIAAAVAAIRAAPADLGPGIAAALDEAPPLLKRDGGFLRAGFRDDLDEARALRDESRRVIAALQGRYAEETGVKALKIRHNAVLGWYVEVPQAQAERLTGDAAGRFAHRQTMAGAMRFSTPELDTLASRIAGAADRALAIELAVFDALARAIVAAAGALKAVAQALAVLDVAQGFAETAARCRHVRPVVERSLAFTVTGGRHPVVEDALAREAAGPFIANDCRLGPPEGGEAGLVAIVTGPNMGGKSTYLRQNALIAVLAQAGAFVPAEAARIGVVDRLFSRVGASDDLARGRSTFMVEMVETAAILNQAGERALVVLDEVGRGTATYDGLSIAWAAVEHLAAVCRCRTLFATHYHELTVLADRLERVVNLTMRVKEWKGDVVFLHEVAHGAADRSYGIQVARLAGLPPAVIARAKAVLARLESGGGGKRGSLLADDLPLFSAAEARAPVKPPPPDPALVLLDALAPDDLSPREALEALYRLKAARRRDGG